MARTAGVRTGGADIDAGAVGYLVEVDLEQMRSLAETEDVVLELVPRVGDHLLPADPLVRVWPAAQAEELTDRVRRCAQIAESRSARQDLRFAQQQVVELAVRALSPGTNDPYTAVNAIEERSTGLAAAHPHPHDLTRVEEHLACRRTGTDLGHR